MNRGRLVARTAAYLGLGTDVTEELTLLQEWANEGVLEVLLETHCYIQIGDLTLTSGTSEYRQDTSILAIDDGRGSTPSGIGPYQLVTLADMIQYQSISSVSPTWQKLIAFQGDLMIVHPVPSTGETLRFYYVPRPSAMTDDSHDPSNATYGGIPSEYHRAIEYYMRWQAAEYDDKGGGFFRGHAFAPGSTYKQSFDEEIKKILKRKRKKEGGRTLRPARVGYPGSQRVPLRNDVYPGGRGW